MTVQELENIICKDAIEVDYEAVDKNDAIIEAGKLLLKADCIEERYIDAMVQVCEELGPYIVLVPGLAMPHARPESGAKKLGISVLKLKKPIVFGHPENDPVNMLIALSAPDNNSHIQLLSFLSKILLNDNSMLDLLKCNSAQELYDLIFNFAKQLGE